MFRGKVMKMACRITKLITTTLILLASQVAYAAPANLEEITGISGTSIYTDMGGQAVQLIDTDGVDDDATAFLFFELAGFASTNSFGIYDYSTDGMGGILLGNTLEVFNGASSPLTSVTLSFNFDSGTGTWTVTNQTTNITENIDDTFGFYLEAPQNGVGTVFYTHTSLNSDGVDHVMMFDTSDNSVGALLGSNVVVAWEDLTDGGDFDYNDMVVGVSDVRPVPEPSIIALMGIGLFGFGLASWRSKKA